MQEFIYLFIFYFILFYFMPEVSKVPNITASVLSFKCGFNK